MIVVIITILNDNLIIFKNIKRPTSLREPLFRKHSGPLNNLNIAALKKMNEKSILNDLDKSFDKEKTFMYHEDFIESDNENNQEYLDKNNLNQNNDYCSSGGEYLEELDTNEQLIFDDIENNKLNEFSQQIHSSFDENSKNNAKKLETIKESVTELMQANIRKLQLNEKFSQNNSQIKKAISNSRSSNTAKPPVDANLKRDALNKKQISESPSSAKSNKSTPTNQSNHKNMPMNKSTSNLNGIIRYKSVFDLENTRNLNHFNNFFTF